MTTHTGYDEHTTATEVAEAFASHIRGKIVTIVGVSPNSLGESMALAFASQQPDLLILASRTESKIQAVIENVKAKHGFDRMRQVQIDLSEQSSVREAAKQIASLTDHVDILVNNAAIVTPKRILTSVGQELQFSTTFVGPFLLTNLLLPLLSKSPTSGSKRIINVTSQGHRLCPVRFSDLAFAHPISSLPTSEQPPPGIPAFFLPKDGETYAGFLAYAQSKSANILFSQALTSQLRRHGIMSFSVHPGSIWTELSRNLDEDMANIIGTTGGYWKTLDEGGAPMMVAALDPKLDGQEEGSTCYFSECQLAEPADHAKGQQLAERLWRLGEELVGERFSWEGREPVEMKRNAGTAEAKSSNAVVAEQEGSQLDSAQIKL